MTTERQPLREWRVLGNDEGAVTQKAHLMISATRKDATRVIVFACGEEAYANNVVPYPVPAAFPKCRSCVRRDHQ